MHTVLVPTKASVARNDRIRGALLILGARVVPGAGQHELDIETLAGPLSVHLYDGWVACRFHDVRLARETFPELVGRRALNPYSGKYNYHHGKTPTKFYIEAAVAHVRYVLPTH